MKTSLHSTRSGRHAHPLLLAALFLSVVGCHSKPTSPTAPATAGATDPAEVAITPEIASNIKVGLPQTVSIHGQLEVPARVETDARRIARVGSPVSGRILRLLVFEGQTVHAGTVLATLHSNDLSGAQLALVKAHSQQVLDASAARRAEQLVAADVIGRAELERRQAELLQAQAETASYRTQLRGLGLNEEQIQHIEASSRLNADYPIVAPKAGTVLERKITVGQVVQPADPAFTIADLSTVWIVANVPDEEAGALHPGLEVSVRIPALPDGSLKGQLAYVAPIVDPATRTVEVRMNVSNSTGRYKPDELASMVFTGRGQQRLTVPSAAVVRDENKDYLYVQTGPQKFRMREVTLGTEENDRRVIESGLGGDERIVTEGAFHLNNQRKQNAIKEGS